MSSLVISNVLEKLSLFAHGTYDPLKTGMSPHQFKTFLYNGRNDILGSVPYVTHQMLTENDWLCHDFDATRGKKYSSQVKVPESIYTISNVFFANFRERHPILSHISYSAQDWFCIVNKLFLEIGKKESIKEPSFNFDVNQPKNLCFNFNLDSLSEVSTMNQQVQKSITSCSVPEVEQPSFEVTDITLHLADAKSELNESRNNKKNKHPHKITLQLCKKKVQKHNSGFDLNEELTLRKNQELSKHSKKRRRRQKKKILQSKSNSNSLTQKGVQNCKNGQNIFMKATITDCDEEVNSCSVSPKSASQWLSRGKVNAEIMCLTLQGKTNGLELSLHDVTTSDSDSDWDVNSSSEILLDEDEFEFCGLLMTNLATPTMSKMNHLTFVESNETYEIHDDLCELSVALRKVNRLWSESIKELDHKPKLPTKVSFAPDDALVDVLHIEMYERKGEWEMYATERFRFKRRIEKIETILSPYLTKQHRLKVLQRNVKLVL